MRFTKIAEAFLFCLPRRQRDNAYQTGRTDAGLIMRNRASSHSFGRVEKTNQ